MKLIVNQYDNSTKTLNELANKKEDCLTDIVFAIELGFTNQINGRVFFNSHIFCFHYLVDVYNGEKNVSFDILNPHEKTEEYCYWEYTSNFYKEDIKSKKIQIENAQLNVPKVKELFDIKEGELFESIIGKIKKSLLQKHENILVGFKDLGINYDSSAMDKFSDNLKKFIDISYVEIEESELKPFIKEYQANALNINLPSKEIFVPKRKI